MRLFLATCSLLLLLAAPAVAAPAWLPPTQLGADVADVSSIGKIAVAADGSAVAAWAQALPNGSNFVLQYSRRAPGGTFSAPVTVSGTTGAGSVEVEVDRDASATIAFLQGTTVRAMRVPRSGAASEPETIETGGSSLALAVGFQGRAVVAYVTGSAGTAVVRSAVRGGASGAFADAKTISSLSGGASGIADVDAAVGDNGTAAVVWTRDDGVRNIVEANTRTPTGDFSSTGESISDTSPGLFADQGAVAIDGTGRVTALWRDASNQRIAFAERPGVNGSVWSSPQPVSSAPAQSPDVAVAPSGVVVAVWEIGTTGANKVETRSRAANGGAFGDLRELSGPSMDVLNPTVAVGRRGDALFVWTTSMGEAIYAVHRTRGGAFSGVIPPITENNPPPNQELSFFSPSVGVDDQGNAFAAWTHNAFHKAPPLDGKDHYFFQAGAFDFAAPSLTASVPGTGVATLPIGMAATAVDRLSSPAISWSFGDGTTATGGAVSHAFASRGAFTVTVSARDGVGNAVSTTAPVLVSGRGGGKRIDSTVQTRWAFDAATGRKFLLLRLRVKDVPKGGAVQIRCKGKKCPYKSKRSTKRRKGDITMFKNRSASKALKSKGRRFRAGQRVQIRVTAPDFIGKVVKFKLKRKKDPVGKVLCLPVGKSKPQKSC